ncbi:uncharacterized protein [Ptychodera flava]|uniref:uncharacterized protein n=1 Tax=Ptychodera flava TaxID=63121 RepID=UPI00396A180A
MQMTTSPTILYCEANLIDTQANLTAKGDCTDEPEASDTVYTNIVPDRIQVEMFAEYFVQNITSYPKPYYINNFTVGVVASSFDWFVQRDGYAVLNGSVTCSTGHDKDNPNEDLNFCDVFGDLNFTFDNHDKVYVTTSATNGGYVDIRNFDNPAGYTVDPKQYYDGQTVSHVVDFTLDFEKPEHCSITASCSDHMLDVGAAVTKRRKLSMHWSGGQILYQEYLNTCWKFTRCNLTVICLDMGLFNLSSRRNLMSRRPCSLQVYQNQVTTVMY